MPACSVFWFRRDLRLKDNAGLQAALAGTRPVLPLFILDSDILDTLPADDSRVAFLFAVLRQLQLDLQELGSGLLVLRGRPAEVWQWLPGVVQAAEVHANRDYEPYAQQRDDAITCLLSERGIPFALHKDSLLFEPEEILKADGSPYTVYTPYSRRWLQRLLDTGIGGGVGDSPRLGGRPRAGGSQVQGGVRPQASGTGFPGGVRPHGGFVGFSGGRPAGWTERLVPNGFSWVGSTELAATAAAPAAKPVPPWSLSGVDQYHATRDFPALDSGSYLGPHLRFGTVNIRHILRQLFTEAADGSSSSGNIDGSLGPGRECFLGELIWREFFTQILYHFPQSAAANFKRKYDGVHWRKDASAFAAWTEGRTGFPLVDAGMRQLRATGSMHNRVRMVCASFLCKDLLLDWRQGEAWFAAQLLDYEQSSNVGNWQWSAGTGCDAAPYFRIFNPIEQQKRWDPQLDYVKRWIPEYGSAEYPKPIVDHAAARQRALAAYKAALG